MPTESIKVQKDCIIKFGDIQSKRKYFTEGDNIENDNQNLLGEYF